MEVVSRVKSLEHKMLVCIAFLFICISLKAQNQNRIDSLLAKLPKAKQDTYKVDILLDLGIEYRGLKVSEKYISEALQLSNKINYPKGRILSLENMGIFYAKYLSDNEKSKEYFLKALEFCNKGDDKSLKAQLFREYISNLDVFDNINNKIAFLKELKSIDSELGDQKNYCYDLFSISFVFYLSFFNKDSSYYYINEEIKYVEKSDNDLIKYSAYNQIATVYMCYGDRNLSLEYFKKAENLFLKDAKQKEKSFDWMIQTAWLYRNMSYLYFPTTFREKFIELNEKSIYYAQQTSTLKPYYHEYYEILHSSYFSLLALYLEIDDTSRVNATIKRLITDYEKPVNNRELFKMYSALGDFFTTHHKYDKAYNYFMMANAIASKLNDPQHQLSSLLSISRLYLNLENYSKFKELNQKRLQIAIKENMNDEKLYSLIYLAIAHIKLGNLDSAMYYNKEASNLNKIKNNFKYEMYLINNYSLIYEIKKQYQEAISSNLKYIDLAKKYNTHYITDLETPESNLARVYLKTANYPKALEYGLIALSQSKMKMNDISLKDNYYTLYEIYRKTGKTEKALQSLEQALIYKEKIQNQKSKIALEESIEKSRDIEMTLLNERNKRKENEVLVQQKILAGGTLGTLILGILLLISVRNYRHKQKANNILEQQKEEIITQSEEIICQRDKLYQQQKDITDSLEYASLIQHTLLSSEKTLSANFSDYFILYKPRDIISGDFYWFKQIKNYVFIVVADCTGHGVPGAFMSVLGISLLNDIVGKRGLDPPADTLCELRKRIKKSLRQESSETLNQDGMDIAYCRIDLETMEMQFAGAYNPLYIIRDKQLFEYKADHMPVGVHPHDSKAFTNQIITLQKGDSFYIFSDGYTSQFGGELKKKFGSKAFKELLLTVQSEPMNSQKQFLETTLSTWAGTTNQVDDISVVGIRI